MEKEALPESHSKPCLAYIIRIPSLGDVEGKKQDNLQRGKENNNRIMGNYCPEYKRKNPRRELVPRGLGDQSSGRSNNGKIKPKSQHAEY